MAKVTITAQCRICGADVSIKVDKELAKEMRSGGKPVTICKECASRAAANAKR